MKSPGIQISIGLSILALALPARAQTTYNFISSGSNTSGTYDYSDPSNWSGGTPETFLDDTTNTAIIGNGANVGYYSAENGDLIISGGATLYITNGTFTQVDGGSYLDLGRGTGTPGYGNLVINGGVFNQGTISSNPFNSEGVGNTFTITAGIANFDNSITNLAGLAWSIQGGTVNAPDQWTINNATGPVVITGGTVNGPGATTEFDINSGGQLTMNGGQFSIAKLMNLGNSVDGVNFGGGVFIDGAQGSGGWYGANPLNFNFTVNSSGTLEFAYGGASNFANYASALSQINTWISNGDISYESGTDVAAFTVSDNGSGDALVTDNFAIPEPSTYALFGFGGLGMWFFVRRKKTRILS